MGVATLALIGHTFVAQSHCVLWACSCWFRHVTTSRVRTQVGGLLPMCSGIRTPPRNGPTMLSLPDVLLVQRKSFLRLLGSSAITIHDSLLLTIRRITIRVFDAASLWSRGHQKTAATR